MRNIVITFAALAAAVVLSGASQAAPLGGAAAPHMPAMHGFHARAAAPMRPAMAPNAVGGAAPGAALGLGSIPRGAPCNTSIANNKC